MPRKAVVEKGEVEFFSAIDMSTKDPTKPASSHPAWFFEQSLYNLRENIEQEERELKMANIPDQNKPIKVAKIKRMKERLAAIEEAKENLRPNRDKLNVLTKELGEKLSEIMPSRTDEQKGYYKPHEMVKHWTEPCIEVSPEVAKIASDNGIHVQRKGGAGLINEVDAGRLWKWSRAALGEDTNIERLRRD